MMPNTISVPVESPLRLEHTNSEFCWCEPALEWDEDGKQVVVHKEVTWN